VTIQSNEQWFSLIDAFQSAALGERSWEAALQGLALTTGSQSAQLIGRKADLTVLFNIMTNTDPALLKMSEDLQSINPRPPVVLRTPLLETVTDADVLPAAECRRNAFYAEVLRPWDRPFFCATVLERHEDLFVTLGVMRSQAAGHILEEQRGTFALLLPHVRAALRLHAALETKAAGVLAGAMEQLAIPLFLCDRSGRVRALTAAAEALVASGGSLELKDGRLHAARLEDTRALEEAIRAALPVKREPGLPAARTVVVHGGEPGAAPIVLDVFALPTRAGSLSVASVLPQVLIVACGRRRVDARRAAILATVYELTAAETDIAQQLAAGQSAAIIAERRGVAVGTVRAQIKNILTKLGLRRQTELAVRLNQL